MSGILYVSGKCSHCQEAIRLLDANPGLKGRVRVVRFEENPDGVRQAGVKSVPTFVDSAGKQHVGAACKAALKGGSGNGGNDMFAPLQGTFAMAGSDGTINNSFCPF